MANEAPVPKAPVFAVVDSSPQLLERLTAFLDAGGERLLHAIQDTVQIGVWPWDKPPENTAQYGAHCAGVAWACKLLRELVTLTNNRRALGAMVASALSAATDAEQLKEVLKRDYGYTDADFKPKES